MSVECVRWVIALRFKGLTPVRRVVLLMLADHANDELGFLAWPSQATLAEECGLSERCVRNVLAWLVKRGFIEVVSPWTQHTPAKYRLPARAARDSGLDAQSGISRQPERNLTTARAARDSAEPLTEPLKEPKKEKTREREVSLSRTQGKAGTPLPEDWSLAPGDREYAEGLGLDPERMAAKFVNHFGSREQEVRTNWSLAFRSYCDHGAESAPRAREPNANAARRGERPALRVVSNEREWVQPSRPGEPYESYMKEFDERRYNLRTLEGVNDYLDTAAELRRLDVLDGKVAEGSRPAVVVLFRENWWWHEHVDRWTRERAAKRERDAAAATREAG